MKNTVNRRQFLGVMAAGAAATCGVGRPVWADGANREVVVGVM